MLNKKKAFTLTELLLALVIVGAIAALTIPTVVNDMNKKTSITQLKKAVSIIELVILNEMMQSDTALTHRDITDTKFAYPTTIFKEFDTTKICDSEQIKECWYTDKYRALNVVETTASHWTPGTVFAKLKNGTALSYEVIEDENYPNIVGAFYIDINGDQGPNIIGRDAFGLYLTRKGQLKGYKEPTNENSSDQIKAIIYGNDFNAGAIASYNYLTMNDWIMDY